jgi:hypothetical protein
VGEHSERDRVRDRELRQDPTVSLDRLVAEGDVRPGRGNLADLGAPEPDATVSLSDVLRTMREDERA